MKLKHILKTSLNKEYHRYMPKNSLKLKQVVIKYDIE